MSEQQYEIEARMHDALVAKDKRIEELETRLKELMDLNARLAESRVRPSDSTIYDEPTYMDLNARLAESRVRPSDSTIYDEPTYGDY